MLRNTSYLDLTHVHICCLPEVAYGSIYFTTKRNIMRLITKCWFRDRNGMQVSMKSICIATIFASHTGSGQHTRIVADTLLVGTAYAFIGPVPFGPNDHPAYTLYYLLPTRAIQP